MAEKQALYFFEYDRPEWPSGRPRKPGRTSWRMTIEQAAKTHPGYRPIMDTVEYRDVGNNRPPDHPGFEPGKGTAHWGKGNLDGQGGVIGKK